MDSLFGFLSICIYWVDTFLVICEGLCGYTHYYSHIAIVIYVKLRSVRILKFGRFFFGIKTNQLAD